MPTAVYDPSENAWKRVATPPGGASRDEWFHNGTQRWVFKNRAGYFIYEDDLSAANSLPPGDPAVLPPGHTGTPTPASAAPPAAGAAPQGAQTAQPTPAAGAGGAGINPQPQPAATPAANQTRWANFPIWKRVAAVAALLAVVAFGSWGISKLPDLTGINKNQEIATPKPVPPVPEKTTTGVTETEVDRALRPIVNTVNQLAKLSEQLVKGQSDAKDEHDKTNAEVEKLKTQFAAVKPPEVTVASQTTAINAAVDPLKASLKRIENALEKQNGATTQTAPQPGLTEERVAEIARATVGPMIKESSDRLNATMTDGFADLNRKLATPAVQPAPQTAQAPAPPAPQAAPATAPVPVAAVPSPEPPKVTRRAPSRERVVVQRRVREPSTRSSYAGGEDRTTPTPHSSEWMPFAEAFRQSQHR